jgi:hypothetical protein
MTSESLALLRAKLKRRAQRLRQDEISAFVLAWIPTGGHRPNKTDHNNHVESTFCQGEPAC